MLEKILTHEAADLWVEQQRSAGLKIGFTCGAFDLLHAGHVDVLERARGLCDRLVVAVNSDASIRRYKNPLRPANPQEQRMQVIAGLGCVDAVVLMEEDRPLTLIERWQPNLYIKGGDYSGGGLRSASAVESYGGQVVLLPFTTQQSTTAIMKRIAAIESHECIPVRTSMAGPARIAFLDRDGTLIRNVPYLHDPAKVEVLPEVPEGLRRLQEAGFSLVMVTNQQGIGLGYFPIEAFFEVNLALFRALSRHGIKIDKVYFCPHSMAADCDCRKPGTAMLEKALMDFQAVASDCWILGDSASDIEAGKAVGCPGLLIDQDAVAPAPYSFSKAVDTILKSSVSISVDAAVSVPHLS